MAVNSAGAMMPVDFGFLFRHAVFSSQIPRLGALLQFLTHFARALLGMLHTKAFAAKIKHVKEIFFQAKWPVRA